MNSSYKIPIKTGKKDLGEDPNNKCRNIRLVIEYDGTSYAGWQRLGEEKGNGKKSIQGILEECILAGLLEEVKLIGSGRTDAGVHALGQVANFHCFSDLSVKLIKIKLNELLPEDIRIVGVEEVDPEFHSRFFAKTKTYEYRIDLEEVQSVFTRKYKYHLSCPLDVDAMRQGAKHMIGTHDFKAFSTDKKDGKSTVRTIEAIHIRTLEKQQHHQGRLIKELRITITGNGFLYNMVRILVGTLIEVGQGKRQPSQIPIILDRKIRSNAGITVYSQGLFLISVDY